MPNANVAAHRPDIDGLRSIAVLLVVLNHAGFSLFSGGFVGVDVFFVISGFLITGIIHNGLLKGSFSFANFYVRRFKRLMPVLFVVLLMTTLAALYYLYPTDLAKYAQGLIWVVFYGANFFFWLEHGGYFEGNAREAPLLHTWSLAVEEQYYMIWPLYMIIGLRLFKPPVLLCLTLLLCGVCVVLSQSALTYTIGAAYYLLPTRMFELMIGSVVAMGWNALPPFRQPVTHMLSLLGLLLIGYSALALNENSPFPGYNALPPTFGAALLILGGNGPLGVGNRLLSLAPFAFIGLISYSLYLWHWPILVFIRYQDIPLTLPIKLSYIAASILLAWMSWKYVEQPMRQHLLTDLTAVTKRWLTPTMLATVSVATIIIASGGFKDRFPDTVNRMDEAYSALSHQMRALCHSSLYKAGRDPDPTCRLGATEREPSGLLFGDSHANHLVGFVDVVAKAAGVSIQDYTLDQCPPLFDFAWGSNAVRAEVCEARDARVLAYLREQRFRYVLLGASWPYRAFRLYQDGKRVEPLETVEVRIEEAFNATLDMIIALGAVPVVFDDVPYLGALDPKCPIKRMTYDSSLDCTFAKNTNDFFVAITDRAEQRHPTMIRVKLPELMCDGGRCARDIDGVPMYSDNDHLNYLGSRHLGELYLESHPNPLSRQWTRP